MAHWLYGRRKLHHFPPPCIANLPSKFSQSSADLLLQRRQMHHSSAQLSIIFTLSMGGKWSLSEDFQCQSSTQTLALAKATNGPEKKPVSSTLATCMFPFLDSRSIADTDCSQGSNIALQVLARPLSWRGSLQPPSLHSKTTIPRSLVSYTHIPGVSLMTLSSPAWGRRPSTSSLTPPAARRTSRT